MISSGDTSRVAIHQKTVSPPWQIGFLPGNPRLVWPPAFLIREGECVNLSMDQGLSCLFVQRVIWTRRTLFLTVWTPKSLYQNLLMMTFLRR